MASGIVHQAPSGKFAIDRGQEGRAQTSFFNEMGVQVCGYQACTVTISINLQTNIQQRKII